MTHKGWRVIKTQYNQIESQLGHIIFVEIDYRIALFLEIQFKGLVQSTLVISKSKGLYETLRDIRTSTYQICGTDENN